jgi:nitroreductase
VVIRDLIGQLKEPVRFNARAVGDESILAVLEAARLAPSANNAQIWRFFVIEEKGLLKEAAALSNVPAFMSAPTIIAACADPWVVGGKRGREQPFFMIDIPIAATHIILTARELGISSALSFDFDEKRVLGLVRAPKDYRAVLLIALGYAEGNTPGKREAPGEIVRTI